MLVVANKVDNSQRELESAEFYNFGLGEVYNISAASGSGTGELLDAVVEELDWEKDVFDESALPRITIVGRPNAGKSSLTNALLNQERNIVTDISGTTRDTVETRYQSFGFDFKLVDTAGIRKKTKIDDDIEFYSVLRTYRAIENSDVCILMIDATLGLERQDLNIFYAIEKNKKGVVVLINC